MSQKNHITIENFDVHSKKGTVINSPKSIEACRRQGVVPDDLLFKTQDDVRHLFMKEHLDNASIEIRFNHIEKNRRRLLADCIEERQKLVDMEKAGIDPFSPQSLLHLNSSGISGGSPGLGNNNMVEKELRAIEKMKKRQQQEIELMMQLEMKMQNNRTKAEQKAYEQQQKELHRKNDIDGAKIQRILKKQKDEEKRKLALQKEESERFNVSREAQAKQRIKKEEEERKIKLKEEQHKYEQETRKTKQGVLRQNQEAI